MSSKPSLAATLKLPAVQAQWQRATPRERTLVLTAAAVVVLALLWWLTLAPALRVWKQSEVQQQSLDAQLQTMQSLQVQAQALQSRPVLSADDAAKALEGSVVSLGSGARLTITGDRATLNLRNVPAGALSAWLAQARLNARALPVEAKLVRAAAPAETTPAAAPSMPPRSIAGALPLLPGAVPGAMSAAPSPAPAAAPAGSSWDGSLVLALPPR